MLSTSSGSSFLKDSTHAILFFWYKCKYFIKKSINFILVRRLYREGCSNPTAYTVHDFLRIFSNRNRSDYTNLLLKLHHSVPHNILSHIVSSSASSNCLPHSVCRFANQAETWGEKTRGQGIVHSMGVPSERYAAQPQRRVINFRVKKY